MRYLSVKEASDRWNISGRRIRVLCSDGRIDGAIKTNWTWMIPEDAPRPRDGRRLRRLKSYDIRVGQSDINRCEALRERLSEEAFISDKEAFDSVVSSLLECAFSLDGENISKESILKVLRGDIDDSLSLKSHILISNYAYILNAYYKKEEKLSDMRLRELRERLFQGIRQDEALFEDKRAPKYQRRDEDDVSVGDEIESLMIQYELSWSSLNGIAGAVLLFGELLRINPLRGRNFLFSTLVLSIELLRNGYLMPSLRKDDIEDLKGALIFSIKRGNYIDLSHLVENAIYRSYEEYGIL